ncbi:MAG: DUF1998 domain-containing protein [Desulfuromusa sp.]
MKNDKYTPVRFSHLTSYAGVGAIVRDANDMLMAVVDTRYWVDKDGEISAKCIPNVTRIINALEIEKDLRMPPTAKVLENGRLDGSYLPAVLFPTYAVCKKCGLLHNNPWKISGIYSAETIECEQCKGELEQVTWCAVSCKGDLSDVPWHYLCHQSGDKDCKVDYSKNYLRLTTDKNGHKIIQCQRCKYSNRYDNRKGENDIGVIDRQQPWIYEKPNIEEGVEILEINNPGVYLPERVNALVIPPESRIGKGTIVDQLSNNSKLCRELQSIKLPLRKKAKIKEVAKEYKCSVKEVQVALTQISPSQTGDRCPRGKIDDFAIGDLLEDEYNAFLTPIDDINDDEDFVTVHKTEQWRDLKNKHKGDLLSTIRLVDQLIIAKRLREIQIFKGFSRIPPEDPKNKVVVPPDIVGTSTWLPAIELFGEGLFFTLNESILQEWERISSVKARANEIDKRHKNSEVTLSQDDTITPRFLLLHTLSHLLIRELETTAGYPATSLKERIYCSMSAKMSGILIYTAVPDIVGSLGGIIESAEPDAFITLLDGVFKHSQWCSLDPVCTEHEGQGPGWLNRAACHACALVPEPSCNYNNIFLDRIFIKGSEESGIPNLLEFVGGMK